MRPLLSVIVPTYNRATFLRDAVDSALLQSGVAVEVVVVDDGSTDDTPAVVALNADRWGDRVRYVWQENAERGAARNRGFQLARGEFVAFLDSDDVWQSEHARACIDALRANPGALAAYGECGLMTKDGSPIRDHVPRRHRPGIHFVRDLCMKRMILHPTEIILRRDWLASHRGGEPFDPSIPGGEDWLLWVELVSDGDFVRVPFPTVWMRMHPGNTFGDPRKFEHSLMLAARKVVATGVPQSAGVAGARVIAINHVHCAYAFYLSGNRLDMHAHMREALRVCPTIVTEPDFRMVLLRWLVGSRLGRRIRTHRNRPRPGVATTAIR